MARMQSRLPILISTLAAVATLAVAGCGGDDASTTPVQTLTEAAPTDTTASATDTTAVQTAPAETTPAEQTVTVTVAGGKASGDTKPTVKLGEPVVITLRSDVADELHLHGYDRTVKVAAGGTARLRFVADVPGRFEAEMHDTGMRVLLLTVR